MQRVCQITRTLCWPRRTGRAQFPRSRRGSGLANSATPSNAPVRQAGYGFILLEDLVMRTQLWLVLALVLGVSVPVFADRRSDAKAQAEFGIAVAQRGLWKEAAHRWERAVEIDPTFGAAWNNLGIGFEQLGRFDDARRAYEKAIEVEPNNTYIRNNYDLFREIYDRQNRRRDR